MNVSIPYSSNTIFINQAQIWPQTSTRPHVYANQVLLDISPADLQTIISSGQLSTSHEAGHGGGAGGFFGLSYRQSLRPIPKHQALVFQFDVVDIFSDQPNPPFTQALNDPEQEFVQMIILEKSVMSAFDPVPSFEIVKADLVPRKQNVPRQLPELMSFNDWDAFGRKGTLSHFFSSLGSWMLEFMTNSTLGLFFFMLGVVMLFVVVCIIVIFGCDPCADEYEQAQHGKSSGKKSRRQHSGDVETGGLRFKTPEELGLLGKGRVVGIGKRD